MNFVQVFCDIFNLVNYYKKKHFTYIPWYQIRQFTIIPDWIHMLFKITDHIMAHGNVIKLCNYGTSRNQSKTIYGHF